MMQNRPSIASRFCLVAFAATLGACATGQDLRETSKKFEGQTTSLEAKIEQLKQTQREAEKSLVKMEQLIEDNKREQSQTRELAAKLNSDLRSFREMDLTKVEGRIERAKKDIEALQGRVEDQVSSLRQNAQQWLAILDQKQTAKLDQQVVRVDQQVAKVEARLETLDKREAAAATRIQETLTTLGKKIDERLDVLTRLRRKYGDTEAAMLAFRDEVAAELDRLARHEEILAAQERLLAELQAELAEAAGALSDRRRAAGERLGPQAERELRALGMERAVFRIALECCVLEDVSPRGLDRAEFRLSTNPGEELRPLARVASGGELSRTMLALKTVLARADRVPTMVFDEVDAGIGGRVAAVVAQKLTAAAEGRQVLCVTHLAPIAARAHRHVQVAKSVRGGRTRVAADLLTGAARVEEIARMLGGERVTDTARGHARELLGDAG